VAVAGSFNQWSQQANPLTSAGDGLWEATVLVPRGKHRYQFRVDGQWVADPLAERQAPDGLGHVDSVLDL
jgi:1,4-alpha-glucan branching enzyme